jgi:hypothetical protein
MSAVFTSAPGSLHVDGPGESFTVITGWPAVWIPAFLAPVALSLHVARPARQSPA